MLVRQEFIALLIIVAYLSTMEARPGFATHGGFSKEFIEDLNFESWSGLRAPQRRSQRRSRPLVRVNLRNVGANDLVQICVYDLMCDEVVFRGRIERRRKQSFRVCSDSRVRGHIVVLDAFQDFFMFRDLRSPVTIEMEYRRKLEYKRSR